jgi:hypothetical protein
VKWWGRRITENAETYDLTTIGTRFPLLSDIQVKKSLDSLGKAKCNTANPEPTSILNSHIKPPQLPPRPPSHVEGGDMAQGKVKGMQTSKQKSARQSSSSTTKKGKRYIAPKKADAIKIASLKKVRTHFLLSVPSFYLLLRG